MSRKFERENEQIEDREGKEQLGSNAEDQFSSFREAQAVGVVEDVLKQRLEIRPEENIDAESGFALECEKMRECFESERELYLEKYQVVVKASRGIDAPNIGELRIELAQQRELYLEAKRMYGQALVLKERQFLAEDGKEGQELDDLIEAYIKTELFQKLIIDEEKYLIERRSADYPPKTVGLLKRMYQRWDDLSSVQKTLITSGIMTGIAFTASAISGKGVESPELVGTALFFSKTFLVGLGQDVLSGLVGSGVHTGLTKKIEQHIGSKVDVLQTSFDIDNLHEVSLQYHKLLESKMRLHAGALLTSALATVASGRAFASGLSMLSQASIFTEVGATMKDSLKETADVISGLSETETFSKGFSGIAKRALSFFKKSSIDT